MKADLRGTLAVFALGVASLLLVAGSACRRELPVATALHAEGTVERGHQGVEQPVVDGTAFGIGDTLRTGAASQARLSLVSGGVIRVGENARLRFQRGMIVGRPAPEIAVELGSAEIEEATSDMSIGTAFGPVRVARGARARVRVDGETASLEVVTGRAVIMDAGREVVVEAGQGVRIKIGNPEVQRFALKVGAAVLEGSLAHAETGAGADAGSHAAAPSGAAGDGGPSERAADSGHSRARALAALPPGAAEGSTASGRSGRNDGGRADITLAAGESATVHDGHPSAVVRLRVDGVCPGDAVVEVHGRAHRPERVTGSRSVVLRLTPGIRSYRVRCPDDARRAAPRAAGTLTIRRDMGYVPLARQAPVNVIEADGRKYTVLFQTRLPQLTLAWSGAPATGGALELHVESSGGEHVVAASPTRPLPRETVQEGTYTLWYRTSDGKESARTALRIRFDNAAPTAQFFRASADTGSAVGVIAVDGVTVEGAKVSVGGEPLAVDTHGRFRAEATPLEGDDAVAVRLEHPRIGIHYYVRRRAEAR